MSLAAPGTAAGLSTGYSDPYLWSTDPIGGEGGPSVGAGFFGLGLGAGTGPGGFATGYSNQAAGLGGTDFTGTGAGFNWDISQSPTTPLFNFAQPGGTGILSGAVGSAASAGSPGSSFDQSVGQSSPAPGAQTAPGAAGAPPSAQGLGVNGAGAISSGINGLWFVAGIIVLYIVLYARRRY